jgi:iron complex outermembrane receptor protein
MMEYWDMLLETGKLSDVGYAIKENVPRSWRRGIELAARWNAQPWLQVGGNVTLSTNKIRSYTAYYEMYDNMNDWNYLGQHKVNFENTDILMSPAVVGMASVTFRPFAGKSNSLKSAYATLSGKYVGKQYYDNTSSDERSIPAYFVGDMTLGYEISSLALSFHVHNLFNRKYYADAWLWRAYFQQDDVYYSDTGIYPQAPVNFMFKASWRF